MANGSKLTGVADGLGPRKSAGMPDVITCTSEGDDLSGRRRRGVNRPDDAPAGQRTGASPVPGLAMTRPLVVTGIPCASRMIPLESPVLEIGTPGSESGGRKRAHGSRPAARLRKHRISHRLPTGNAPPLDSTTTLPTGVTPQARDSWARARERGNVVSVTVLRANGQRDGVGKTSVRCSAFEHTRTILDSTRVSPYGPAAQDMPQAMRPDTRQHLTACTEPSEEMELPDTAVHGFGHTQRPSLRSEASTSRTVARGC